MSEQDERAELAPWLTKRGIVPAGARWTVMRGGRTNRLWRVSGGAGAPALVVKLYSRAAPNPMFPNDPAAEARTLRHLSGQGLAPTLLALVETPLGACLVYRYVPGAPWRGDPAAVGRLLRRLHGLSAPEGLRALPGDAGDVVAQTGRILSHLPPPQARAHMDLEPRHTPPAPATTGALLHGDAVPGNLLVAGDRITLIDWQCPARGDPVEDLAIFLSPAMQQLYRGRPLDRAERAAFLAAYDAPDTAARLHALAPWHHWRMAAYCLWRMHRGAGEYAAGHALERAALQERCRA